MIITQSEYPKYNFILFFFHSFFRVGDTRIGNNILIQTIE